MFKDFGKRLQRDVKAIVDGRIAGSEQKSGSLMKVSSLNKIIEGLANGITVERCRCQCHFPQETTIRRVVRWFPHGVNSEL